MIWSFLRHGESIANAEGWLAGHTDADLTHKGVRQALAVRDALEDIVFERVVVSDLLRARRTAALALPTWDVVVDSRVRERTLGDWEGRTRKELREEGAMATLLSWHGRPPRGESQADLADRVTSALIDYEDGVPTLIVCHGGVMRAMLGLLDGEPESTRSRVRYPNCALQVRQLERGRLRSLESRAR